MGKKEKTPMTEQELNKEARRILNEKKQKASQEINAILKKYGMTLKIIQTIDIIPTR